MDNFETLILDAVAAQEIPGCVLVATNRDGSFRYEKSFGKSSMKEQNEKLLQPDTVMWVASCTKLMTSICCMQLVERGLVGLDEPVDKHIPELKSLLVVKGFRENGEPIEENYKTPITLRHLLTHTSGLVYDGMHPTTLAWLNYKKLSPGTSGKVLERFNAPLVFEPGESWAYGSSTDYAGLLIERITGQTLEVHMRQNLWEPLGIRDMTFHLSSRPDMRERMADMSLRDEKTGKVRPTGTRMPYVDGNGGEVEDCFGGQGVFTTPEEYIKVVHALLTCDEEEKLFKRATLEEFFSPQLGEGSSKALNMILQDDVMNNAMGGTPKDVKKDWGLGGLLITADTLDGKKAGTMIWGGAPNLIWWVDRKAGLCGLYAGQVWPPGDAKCSALNGSFQEGMYQYLAEVKQRMGAPNL